MSSAAPASLSVTVTSNDHLLIYANDMQ